MVMFQPQSGTAPILGSIANVTSLLSLPHLQLFYVYLPFTCPVPTYPLSTTLRLSDTTIFAPDYSPSILVLDLLVTQESNPSGLHRPYLRSLSCCHQPAPQVPLIPCSPAPRSHFFHLFPRPVAPLSPPSKFLASLLNPVGTPF